MPVIVVGVLNVTPDSFSDGGRFASATEAVSAAVGMVDHGTHWIDVGGESTRPHSQPVDEAEEIRRVVPVIELLAARLDGRARISIDTYKAGTAAAALAAGASIVNDVSGGKLDPDILRISAKADATLILGHLRGRPASMMVDVHFDDVVREVADELAQAVASAREAGCNDIWIDPGIGFGKLTQHNLELLRDLPTLKQRLGLPMMVGVSRKRFIGDLTGKPVEGRRFGTAAAVAAAILGGADAVRVHDTLDMVDVVRVADAIASTRLVGEKH